MKEFDYMTFKEIQKIIKDFEKSNVTELELTFEEVSIKLSKNTYNRMEQKTVTPIETKLVEENEKEELQVTNDMEIKSPLVGTFYRKESPDAKPFVEVGSVVKKGDVLCIIEAMKIMNEITAPQNGKITKILLNNEDVVGFDQVLMTMVPSDEA